MRCGVPVFDQALVQGRYCGFELVGLDDDLQVHLAQQVVYAERLDTRAGKGALIYSSRTVHDKKTGDKLTTLTSTTFARGDGGFGGPTDGAPKPHELPDRAPDSSVELPTLLQQALIYRLSGDFNPLHADPRVATAAGFKAPILHGLASLGVAGHAVLRQACNYDPAKLKAFNLRFSSPVEPGETLVTEM